MESTKVHYKIIIFPIFLMIVVFILWASLLKIDEFVRGIGKIIPSREIQKVQHLEGGIISDIYIKEGQNVKKGEVLFRVSNEFAVSELADLRNQLYASEAKEIRLKAELADAEYVQFTSELLERIPAIVDNERKLFQERRSQLRQQLEIANSKLDIARQGLKEKRARLKNLIIEREYAKELRDTFEKLSKIGAGSRSEYLRTIRDYQKLVTEIEDLQNQIPSAERSINEANATSKNVKNTYNVDVQEKLSEVLVKINSIQEDINAKQDRVSRNEIVSPVDGIIQTNYFNTIGGIVKPGDTLVDVIPTDDILVVEAKIKPDDRARVWTGQDVNISVTAYDHSIYGQIKGVVTEVSADTVLEERTGMEFYTIKVRSVDSVGFGADKPLYPGMVAEINAMTGKRTVMQYITKPFRRSFAGALSEE